MATNVDSFPITPEMLAYAWVKPPVTFTAAGGKATTTNVYIPGNLKESAGARGGPNAAVSTDPNYTFAIAAEGPATECNATLVLPPDPISLAAEDEAATEEPDAVPEPAQE